MPEFLVTLGSTILTAIIDAFPAFALIWLITGISMFVRWVAFGRMDSWALEISVAALIYNILYGIYISDTALMFLQNELPRCVILFSCAMAISAIHYHFLYISKEKCREIFDNAAQHLKDEAGHEGIYFKEVGDEIVYDDDEEEFGVGSVFYEGKNKEALYQLEDKKLAYMSKLVMLNEAKHLSEKSISVCYSVFIDEFSYNHKGILRKRKKKDGGASKGFRPGKTKVRIALASVVNNLHIQGMRTLHEDDFNISFKEQKIGLLLFDVFEVLALIIGSFRLF